MPNDHDDAPETETETDTEAEVDSNAEPADAGELTDGADAGDGGDEPALEAAPAKKGKAKRATTRKPSSKKAPPAVRECPPDAELTDYSTKGTFAVGQWVRHPTFGNGYVVDAGPHVTLEFAGVKKILAHIPAPIVHAPPKHRPRKPLGNTVELARAAGVEVKKMPPRFDGEK